MERMALWADVSCWELLGTLLRANAYGKVTSTRKYEGDADDGGHDGHSADLSLLRHHVARPVRALSHLRPWLPQGRLGLNKRTIYDL